MGKNPRWGAIRDSIPTREGDWEEVFSLHGEWGGDGAWGAERGWERGICPMSPVPNLSRCHPYSYVLVGARAPGAHISTTSQIGAM